MAEEKSYIVEIKVKGFRCHRCGHEWVPHDINKPPKTCPNCRSAYWDTPKREPKAKTE